MKQEKISVVNCEADYDTLGVSKAGALTTFSVVHRPGGKAALLLYSKSGGDTVEIPMAEDEDRTGIYGVGLKNLDWAAYDYCFALDGVPGLDPYARRVVGREDWGDRKREESALRCGFPENTAFSWTDDRLPRIPKEEMVMYKLHVRGFSMQAKLAEEERGTFRALERKLSYFQELGITTLELMPAYEFEEIFAKDPFQRESFPADKINYWGYTRGNYFAPKAAFLGKGNTERSVKRLIKAMHKRELECILEFYFDEKCNPNYALDALRFWAKEYHVDGFHVICNGELARLIAQDYHLNGRKLFFDWFPEELGGEIPCGMELFSYNDAFLYSVRKAMNQPGESIREFADNMRRQKQHQGFVNYVASNNGFCLSDLFSYTERQNQANGEENRDGLVVNFSQNCGEEGSSGSKRVNRLRVRQIKNALCALLFSQAVPLIWMGDEDGNTQNGNNNPYCQDNETGWKDWSTSKRSREIRAFFKEAMAIRAQYPALRNPLPMTFTDYKQCGYPDLSYHGEGGWRVGKDGGEKTIGMLYACAYAEKPEFLYIGYNFSGLDRNLALPALPRKYRWERILDTEAESGSKLELEENARSFLIRKQSVCVLAGRVEK